MSGGSGKQGRHPYERQGDDPPPERRESRDGPRPGKPRERRHRTGTPGERDHQGKHVRRAPEGPGGPGGHAPGRGGRRRAKPVHGPARSWVLWVSAGALTLAGGIAAVLGTGDPLAGTPGGTAGGRSGGLGFLTSSEHARRAGVGTDGPAGGPAAAGAREGAPDAGAPRSEAHTSGASQSGVSRDGASRDGASPSGASQDAAEEVTDGPSQDTDHLAAAYFRARWAPDDTAVKHLKDIRTIGGYLRIYTDLPESADNSAAAITLCERGLAYLRESGVSKPVVFVQAKEGGNGNPVLANILGDGDTSCRVTHPAPRPR